LKLQIITKEEHQMSQLIKDERELLSKPGDTILETLEHIKMSQAELAERMGKTASKINDIISGKEPITVNTALQLEKVLNIEAQFWLNREMLYREKLSRIEQEEALEECLDWLKQQPIKELKKYGYIKTERSGTKMAFELLQFYGVASPVQWENIYVQEYANSDFRKSTAHKTALGSMSAWLRIGEVEIKKMNLPEYDKVKFKEILQEIKHLVKSHPEDFAIRLQKLCAEAGVAVVYTPNLPQAPISGATRWIGGNPIIQLTDRYNSNDQFWFTFYHEAGHILLHGKKDVFIESFIGHDLDPVKEAEANKFAGDSLLPDSFINELPAGKITEKDIRRIARLYETHPAIVLGRLYNLGKLPYTFGTDLRMKVLLDSIIYKKRYDM
jgi:addiction module HigA family antidote